MFKRCFDIITSSLGLLVLSPLFIILALFIKVGSRGPVFYRGERTGKDFKPFRIFKFRSMVEGADKLGGPSTRGKDPRLTKIGKFIRRFKLDELPQLINVLFGHMSLVGPRPEVPQYAKLYKGNEKNVFRVRPGITDYASLWNFHEEEALGDASHTNEAEKIYLEKIRPKKVALQMKYVNEMSLLTDLKILLKTLKKLFQ